jgi:hypothetical protein
VLDWAFTVMGLHNILLVTFSWNLRAIRAYSKAGFREIGRRRGAVVTYGQRHDQVLMEQWPMSSPTRSWPSRPRRTPNRQAIHERLMMFVRSSLPPQGRPCGRR